MQDALKQLVGHTPQHEVSKLLYRSFSKGDAFQEGVQFQKHLIPLLLLILDPKLLQGHQELQWHPCRC